MKLKLPGQSRAKGCRGVSLMEVIVATAILGIMLVVLFAGLAGGYSIINTFRQDLRATQILTQKTEFVRLCTWSQVNSLPATFVDYYAPIGSAGGSQTNIIYYGTIRVGTATNLPASAAAYNNTNTIELVTVDLTWTNILVPNHVAHHRRMQTLVSYHGLVNYIYGNGFVQQ